MNPFMQQQMPTQKELWKNEPNKLRIWIVLFLIVLLVFSVFSITGSIMTIVNKQDLLDNFITSNATNKNFDASISNKGIIMYYISLPMICGVATVSSFVYFLFVLPQSYKNKSFANLPSAPMAICYFIGFVAMMNSIGTIKEIANVGNHLGAILVLTSSFLSIVLLFFAIPVGRIRKVFVSAKAYEDLQKSPEFQQMQQQMKNFFEQAANGQNPGSPFGAAPNPSTAQAKPQEAEVKAKENSESPEVKELKKLKISELRSIASKLSISGHAKMPKDELIKSIIRITKGE